MSIDSASFSQDEKALIDLLKKLYWVNGSQSKCHHNKAITSRWDGYPASSQQLNKALLSLTKRGYLEYSKLDEYCLTDSGLRAIGAIL